MHVAATRFETFLKTLMIYVCRLCVCMKHQWHENAHQVHKCTHETLVHCCVHHGVRKECMYLLANMYCTGAFCFAPAHLFSTYLMCLIGMHCTLTWHLDWHIHHAHEQYIVNHIHTSVLTTNITGTNHNYECYSICKTKYNPTHQIFSTAKAIHYVTVHYKGNNLVVVTV